jgi:hypothetical protein
VAQEKTAGIGIWKSLFGGGDQPLLHGTYERVQVAGTTRSDLESMLGPSHTRCYLTRCHGCETVEFITDPRDGRVVAKKYLVAGRDTAGRHASELRFQSTLKVIRQILASRKRPRRVPGGPHYHQPAHPTTLYEWFAGPATEKLLGRAAPGDHYFVNGRPIEPRAYRTLLDSRDGESLLVEVRSHV